MRHTENAEEISSVHKYLSLRLPNNVNNFVLYVHLFICLVFLPKATYN